MKKVSNNKNASKVKSGNERKISLEGYPTFPSKDDIYNQSQKITEGDKVGIHNGADIFGDNLDVPGAELDDEQEGIGSEDEENNYYSIGGDRHDDLEEDNKE